MRQLIIDKIVNHWNESLEVILDTTLQQVYSLPDNELLEIYDTIFEIGV
jgi:hypothetical protein